MTQTAQSGAVASPGAMDRRDVAWYTDRIAQWVIFAGGISAIVFIAGIFVFITKEGLDFVLGPLNLGEFLTSIAWRPTSNNPTYGALALIVGTASVTGFAMLLSVPLSLGAALFIAEFATGKTRETLKILVEMLAAIPSVVWGFVGMSIMNPLIIRTFDVPLGLGVLNAGADPGTDGRAHHDDDRGGRPQGRAGTPTGKLRKRWGRRAGR